MPNNAYHKSKYDYDIALSCSQLSQGVTERKNEVNVLKVFLSMQYLKFIFREEPEESPPPEDTIPEQELLRRSEEISKS